MEMREEATRAYAEHHERWRTRFGAKLAREGHDPDLAWDAGVLDLVAPADPHVRDALRASGCGLPWGGRNDLELYWRIMYAAHAERLDLTDPVRRESVGPRPIRDVAAAYPEHRRAAILLEIRDSAAYQLRLRDGRRRRFAPLDRDSVVQAGPAKGLIERYGFDGSLLLDRETEPADAGGVSWKLDTKRSRWRARVWPWQFSQVV